MKEADEEAVPMDTGGLGAPGVIEDEDEEATDEDEDD